MTFKEVQELIKLIAKSEIAEFKMKEGDFQLSIRTVHPAQGQHTVAAAPAPAVMPIAAPAAAPATVVAPAPAAPAEAAASATEDAANGNYLAVRAPMVGTFYRSPSPEKGPFVKVGDTVEVGSPVCIIEAMKLFNEIESEVKGRIVKVMVEDAHPVEYDQVLFLVDPKG